ncbi:GntR family transcriptional regulator [Streptomyces sp. NBC_01006]|uniref:GntR family transcriptional regulator n=1 Tax=Streptomyces sp. NBC_01006 TaxID=2903716 RepID=UPI00386C91F5|nr:GntR family transcriptional regulator [Streptomyces sp. NBC_01006]
MVVEQDGEGYVTQGAAGGGERAAKGQALYRRVAADLGRAIGEGRYGSGGRLPAEGELAEQYGVSRGTVRQAMALLRTEGLVASRRGTRRVVIGTSRPQSFGELLSFTRWAHSTGEEPGGLVVASGTRPADAAERAHLRLPEGAEVHQVRRLRTLSGRPAMVERTVYPPAIGELIAGLPHDTVSYTRGLEERGVLFADAQHTIDLCRADEEDARLLGCRPGDPLLRERRCSTDPAGTPIEWSEDRYLPETVAFTVHSSAAAGSLARRPADQD